MWGLHYEEYDTLKRVLKCEHVILRFNFAEESWICLVTHLYSCGQSNVISHEQNDQVTEVQVT
jgi:hypothetical protein